MHHNDKVSLQFSLKSLFPRYSGLVVLLIAGIFLSSCSGESFHLRGSVALPAVYQNIYLEGQASNSPFALALKKALERAGSNLVSSPQQATAILSVEGYEEGKRVAGYGENREVRQYLIFLSFAFSTKTAKDNRVLLPASTVNLDRTQIYDSAFVLGKIEEERLIREDLRKNAARDVLLRLRYGH